MPGSPRTRVPTTRYARLAFAVEMAGAAAVVLFGLCSCRAPPAVPAPRPGSKMRYDIHVRGAGAPWVLRVWAGWAGGGTGVRGLAKTRVQPGRRPHGPTPQPATPSPLAQAFVPCYTEALEIVAETVWALHTATVPPGATVTVWLLDDGNDPEKAAWVQGLGAKAGVRYVANRPREAGEVNGKAANLNHALGLLYPEGSAVPDTDVVAVFDCDQAGPGALGWSLGGRGRHWCPPERPQATPSRPAPPARRLHHRPPHPSPSPAHPPPPHHRQVCEPHVFEVMLPALAADPAVALVLSPQRFGNVDAGADIFNHANAHFWDAVLPGMAAWGLVVCAGSNLLLRAPALAAAGGFPDRTVTEDHALGVELAAAGHRMAYVPRYLATGEAPEQGAIFRQRSRWCKGHVQTFLSADCPLLDARLPLAARVLYSSGALAYAAAALGAPMLALAPFVAARWGVAPAGLSPGLVRALVPHLLLMHAVVFTLPAPLGTVRSMWFNMLSSHLLWWTYAKAGLGVLFGAGLGVLPGAGLG